MARFAFRMMTIAAVSGFAASIHAQTVVLSENFDSQTVGSTYGSIYNYGNSPTVTSKIVSPGNGGGGNALQLSGNITNGVVENSGTHAVYTPANNTDTNLADYTLSVDLAIPQGVNSGINIQLDVAGNANSTNGSVWVIPTSGLTVGGGFQHFSINMASTANGYLSGPLIPTSSQYTLEFTLVGYNAAATATPETVLYDNVQITTTAAATTTNNCAVDWNNVHQQIDGFGASSAYDGSWTTNQADILFSTNLNVVYSDSSNNKYTNNGIGLSLLRNHIVPANNTLASSTPTTVETSIMRWAQDRGARVWSTPWTPAVGFKMTNDIYDSKPITNAINGGSFLGGTATNLAYASQLANYVSSMKTTYGINLYAISIQNEPDASVNTYDACQWTNTYIHDFVTNLYNALAAKGLGSTRIILPESQNWQDYRNLAGPAMTDTNVAADVSIIADHNYDGANGPANLVKNSYGKPLWETEVSQLNGETSDITNGIYYAKRLFQFLTVAQASAWHYWWIVPYGSETGLMSQNAGPTKRMFTIGNYSRFVRPGNYRIDVANNNPLLSISAYKDTNSGNFAIVAINPNSTVVTQFFNLTNITASTVTPWITSGNLSLASQPPVAVTNASFAYALPALSVVTFAGQGYVAPASITISSASYNPNTPAFVLTWNSTAGATYSVLKTNVLGGSASQWPVLVSGYPPGGAAGGPLSYTDTTTTVGPAFYRVSKP